VGLGPPKRLASAIIDALGAAVVDIGDAFSPAPAAGSLLVREDLAALRAPDSIAPAVAWCAPLEGGVPSMRTPGGSATGLGGVMGRCTA